MNRDEDKDLWDLLGEAKAPPVSPYFARNVLRTVREGRESRGRFAWLPRHWRVPALAFGVLVVGSALLVDRGQRANEELQMIVLAQNVTESPDYAVIGDLDELLASEESSVWLDDDAVL